MLKLWFYPAAYPPPEGDAIKVRDLDEAYRLIDTYGATDGEGNIVSPRFELVEFDANGVGTVLDCVR